MPTFGRTDQFDATKGYARVLWGNSSKVLDVELTEMQKIMLDVADRLGRSLFNNGFLSKPAMTYSSGTLTVPPDTIFLDGRRIDVTDAMTLSAAASTAVWLAIWEQEVAYTDTIKRSGNQSGGADLPNGILDPTFGSETTRRTQTQIQLVTSNADNTKKYLPVASISAGSVLTDSRVTVTVTLASDPTLALQAATKQYVDAQVALARTYA